MRIVGYEDFKTPIDDDYHINRPNGTFTLICQDEIEQWPETPTCHDVGVCGHAWHGPGCCHISPYSNADLHKIRSTRARSTSAGPLPRAASALAFSPAYASPSTMSPHYPTPPPLKMAAMRGSATPTGVQPSPKKTTLLPPTVPTIHSVKKSIHGSPAFGPIKEEDIAERSQSPERNRRSPLGHGKSALRQIQLNGSSAQRRKNKAMEAGLVPPGQSPSRKSPAASSPAALTASAIRRRNKALEAGYNAGNQQQAQIGSNPPSGGGGVPRSRTRKGSPLNPATELFDSKSLYNLMITRGSINQGVALPEKEHPHRFSPKTDGANERIQYTQYLNNYLNIF